MTNNFIEASLPPEDRQPQPTGNPGTMSEALGAISTAVVLQPDGTTIPKHTTNIEKTKIYDTDTGEPPIYYSEPAILDEDTKDLGRKNIAKIKDEMATRQKSRLRNLGKGRGPGE